VRRVGGVILDPHLAQTEPLGQAIGADERGPACRQAGPRCELVGGPGRPAGERQEVGVAPHVATPGLNAAAQRRDIAGVRRRAVADLERAETAVTDIESDERILAPTLLALQLLCRHMKKPPPVVWRRFVRKAEPQPHLPGLFGA